MTHDVVKMITEVVAISSAAHTLLPPWEVFDDFPTAQKYYKAFIYTIGYFALNGRSAVYGSVSTKNGTQVSTASTPKGDSNGVQVGP